MQMEITEEQLSGSGAKSASNTLKDTEEVEVIKKGRSKAKAVRESCNVYHMVNTDPLQDSLELKPHEKRVTRRRKTC